MTLFYYHDDLIQVMRQIAQVVSFTVKPWSLGKTMLRCELESISDKEMVVIYEY